MKTKKINLEIKPEYLFYPNNVRPGIYKHHWAYRPDLIPVHPKILAEPRFFSSEFIQEIRLATPEMVQRDIEAIEKRLGIKPYVLSGHELVASNGKSNPLRLNSISLDKLDERAFMLNYGSNCWLALDANTEEERGTVREDYFLSYINDIKSNKKLQDIARECIKNPREKEEYLKRIQTWRMKDTHGEGGYPLKVYFRSFAMTYNNLALKELGLIK